MGIGAQIATAAAKNLDHHLSGDAYRQSEGQHTETQEVDIMQIVRNEAENKKSQEQATRDANEARVQSFISKAATKILPTMDKGPSK